MKSALVTGAAGLLGSATVNMLADAGVHVHALVRTADQAFRTDVEFHEFDLSQPLDRSRLPSTVDAIFHLSQAREFRDFPNSAAPVFGINVASTAALLDYATRAAVSTFVYASSGGVYRAQSGVALTEDAPLVPPEDLGFYLATKLSSEAIVGSYSTLFTTASLRYFFIYGPGQSRTMLIPRLYDRVLSGEPISLQGSDGMRINPVHVSDAAAATIAAAALTSSGTVNVAGPGVLSLREIAELFAEATGRPAEFEQSTGAPTDLVASTELMGERLHAPTCTLRQALSDIAS